MVGKSADKADGQDAGGKSQNYLLAYIQIQAMPPGGQIKPRPLSRKTGNHDPIYCHLLIFATLFVAKRIILDALMGEALPSRAESGAAKVPLTFH
jgi:hypothetical protein